MREVYSSEREKRGSRPLYELYLLIRFAIIRSDFAEFPLITFNTLYHGESFYLVNTRNSIVVVLK